jgi:hypothetical protein
MNKKTVYVVVITAIVVLMVAPRLRALPGVNKLPTV